MDCVDIESPRVEHHTTKRQRRGKYISRACQSCQRRKSKCSGHEPCLGCQDRGLVCIYDSEKRRQRKTTSNLRRRAPERISVPLEEPQGPVRPQALSSAEPSPGNSHISRRDQYPESLYGLPITAQLSSQAPVAGASLYRSAPFGRKCISLRSQLAEARASLATTEELALAPTVELYSQTDTYTIELPPLFKLNAYLRYYFQTTNVDYPALERKRTETRIFQTLDRVRYPSDGLRIQVDHKAAPTIALLCSMLAIAETTESDLNNAPNRGSVFYDQSQSLLQEFEHLPPHPELVRCHALNTLYLVHMELLDSSLQSISIAVRLAMLLHLHKPGPSLRPEPDCKSSDHYNLWWTVYVLDRTISRLSGTSYLVRDEEIPVSQHPGGRTVRFSQFIYMRRTCMGGEKSLSSGPEDSSDSVYLDILSYLGRLWALVWDELLSDPIGDSCHWQTAEILDTQIRFFQHQLPPTFTWSAPSETEPDSPKEEHIIRQRLNILMTLNTLRLLIRQSSVFMYGGLDRKESSGTIIAGAVINAVANVNNGYGRMCSPQFSISTALVQCILYLINFINESSDGPEAETASSYVESAYKIIAEMAEWSMSARSAVSALDDALFAPTDVFSPSLNDYAASTSRLLVTNHPYTENSEGVLMAPSPCQAPLSQPADLQHKGNLFQQLRESYGDLDSMSPSDL